VQRAIKSNKAVVYALAAFAAVAVVFISIMVFRPRKPVKLQMKARKFRR
jgi:hypothetical protein